MDDKDNQKLISNIVDFPGKDQNDEDIPLELIKQKIEKSGKITEKTAKILAQNLGLLINKYKSKINLNSIIRDALNIKDQDERGDPKNIKPVERLKYFRLYPNKEYDDGAIKRLAKDPKKYLYIALKISEKLNLDEEIIIRDLVHNSRFSNKNDGDKLDLDAIRKINEVIALRIEKIIKNNDVLSLSQQKFSNKFRAEWNEKENIYEIKDDDLIINPFNEHKIITSVPIAEFNSLDSKICNTEYINYYQKTKKIHSIDRLMYFGARASLCLINEEDNIIPKILILPFIFLPALKSKDVEFDSEYIFYDYLESKTNFTRARLRKIFNFNQKIKQELNLNIEEQEELGVHDYLLFQEYVLKKGTKPILYNKKIDLSESTRLNKYGNINSKQQLLSLSYEESFMSEGSFYFGPKNIGLHDVFGKTWDDTFQSHVFTGRKGLYKNYLSYMSKQDTMALGVEGNILYAFLIGDIMNLSSPGASMWSMSQYIKHNIDIAKESVDDLDDVTDALIFSDNYNPYDSNIPYNVREYGFKKNKKLQIALNNILKNGEILKEFDQLDFFISHTNRRFDDINIDSHIDKLIDKIIKKQDKNFSKKAKEIIDQFEINEEYYETYHQSMFEYVTFKPSYFE